MRRMLLCLLIHDTKYLDDVLSIALSVTRALSNNQIDGQRPRVGRTGTDVPRYWRTSVSITGIEYQMVFSKALLRDEDDEP